jgi:aryl-alcohol dehydrogenase-like predicted oxidoreductase
MKYVRLGKSGLRVSPLCFGCMSFGVATQGSHGWVLDEDTARPFFRQAIEAGINFFDTANVYAAGTSEEFTGRALKEYARRDEIVVATKVWGPMGKGPNQRGLSRKAIFQEVDNSLRRLGMDYIDLYQIHRLDPHVPMEEILEALHDLVKSGKVRYIGASSMYSWQFAKLLYLADQHGWTRFISMQNHVNLLYREEEREMLPLCLEEGIGVIPWSPLARGRLAREWDAKTHRSENDVFGGSLYGKVADQDRLVVDAVGEVAAERGLPRAQVALAWLMAKPGVTAPIIGATKQAQLTEALAALDVTLSDEEVARLEAPYVPHKVQGF